MLLAPATGFHPYLIQLFVKIPDVPPLFGGEEAGARRGGTGMPAGASTLDVLRLELGKRGEVVEVEWLGCPPPRPRSFTAVKTCSKHPAPQVSRCIG